MLSDHKGGLIGCAIVFGLPFVIYPIYKMDHNFAYAGMVLSIVLLVLGLRKPYSDWSGLLILASFVLGILSILPFLKNDGSHRERPEYEYYRR